MAVYTLLGHYSTVQVLSPTLTNPVEYATIQTNASNVIASIPIQKAVFDAGQEGPELTNFANAINDIMNDPNVVAGVGSQTIDANGLLADNVVFTVQYTDANTPPGAVTAEATIPVGDLNFSDALIGETLKAKVEAEINAVYDNLKAAAGG